MKKRCDQVQLLHEGTSTISFVAVPSCFCCEGVAATTLAYRVRTEYLRVSRLLTKP
jgi:hypothetical protein